jgi:hypothetical protein
MKRLPFSDQMYIAFVENRKRQTRRTGGLQDVNSYPGTLEGKGAMGGLGYKGLCPSDYYIKPSLKADYRKNPGLYHWFVGEQNREINPIIVKAAYQVGDTVAVVASIERFNVDGVRIHATGEIIHKPEWIRIGSYRAWKWKPDILPARYCPASYAIRGAKIVGVRAERVQDISEDDCDAEGAPAIAPSYEWIMYSWNEGEKVVTSRDPVDWYKYVWDSINAKRGFGFDTNPYVFVYELGKAFLLP